MTSTVTLGITVRTVNQRAGIANHTDLVLSALGSCARSGYLSKGFLSGKSSG